LAKINLLFSIFSVTFTTVLVGNSALSFCSLLSISWLHSEWEGDVGRKHGCVRLPSLCAKGDQQQANNVRVWSRLCVEWWTIWCNMYWRKMES